MSTTSRQSSTSTQTRIAPVPDKGRKAGVEAEGGSAEPGAGDSAAVEKGHKSERDGDGVLVENGVETLGLTDDDDPYS